MKILIITFLVILSSTSFAGPGHGHSHGKPAISKEKTGEIGRYHVERLIKAGKIDVSWKSSTFDKSEKEDFLGKMEWIVTFKNEKGVKGKKLFIFLNESGEFIAANFTGK